MSDAFFICFIYVSFICDSGKWTSCPSCMCIGMTWVFLLSGLLCVYFELGKFDLSPGRPWFPTTMSLSRFFFRRLKAFLLLLR